MSAPPPATWVRFLCDQPEGEVSLDATPGVRVERLSTIADDGVSNLQIDSLGQKLGSDVPSLAEELLYITTYCVAADQLIDRGSRDIDVHRARWRRRLELVIPVSDPAFWHRPAIMDALVQVLAFATEDAWSFRFTQRPPAGPIQLRINDLDSRQAMGNPDCVVLVSGGTDSLCALVEAIGVAGRHPVAVSHRPAPQIDRWQRDLLDGVRKAFPQWILPHQSFTMHRRGTGDADPAQRTRPVLFAALGTAIAATLDIDHVVLTDNGYVSLNPPISRELAGALASRGTHPTLLRLLTNLNAQIFDRPIRIENPLADRTRAEALRILKDLGCPHLLALTHTCGNHRGRPRHQPHCGICSQCVDRRFAFLAAGLDQLDPVTAYGRDIFTDDLPAGEARKIAWLYRTFAGETLRLDDNELIQRYPEILATIDPDDPLSLLRVMDMLRRHAQEVLAVMEQQVVVHKRALALGDLPPTCLLRIDIPASDDGRAVDVVPRVDPAPPADALNTIEISRMFCRLTFGGEKGEVRPIKGMQQLARLLTAPHQDLPALDLAYDTQPPRPNRGATLEDDLHGGHTTEPLIDEDARKDYLGRADEIRTLLEAGVDDERRSRLRDELEFIDAELKRATGLGGRPRYRARELENARTLVSKNITKALTEIEHALPSLHRHLRATVHLGHVCTYTPDPPRRWQVIS